VSLDTRAVVSRAVALLEREGDGAFGFNRLARALGVKPPSLYNHVTNDADLRRRVAIHGWALFDAACERRGRGKSGAAALRTYAATYRSFAAEHPGLFATMAAVSLDPADPDYAPVAVPLLERLLAPCRALGLDGHGAVHAVRAIRAAVHGFVVLERQGQFRMGPKVERSFDRMLVALLAGLGERAA
jgi:AcrR family transcriptional regulator